eukprot:scaffold48783_cov70-Phaeocystis_antarctica.AAC.2
MANAADWSAASELWAERRKVIKEERSSFGAIATPACFLNTALTSLVHCGAPSGFEASAPGTKTCGCAALVPVRSVEPSHAVSSAAAGAGTAVMVGPKAALVLCCPGRLRSKSKPLAVGWRVSPRRSWRLTPTRSGGTLVSHVRSVASKSSLCSVPAVTVPPSAADSYARTARARAVCTCAQSSHAGGLPLNFSSSRPCCLVCASRPCIASTGVLLTTVPLGVRVVRAAWT